MNQLIELKRKISAGEWHKASENLWRIHDLMIATPEIAREYKKETENSWYQDDVLITEHAFQVSAVLEEIHRLSEHPINRSTGLIYLVHDLYDIVERIDDCRELLMTIVDSAIRIEAMFSEERYLNFAYGSNMDERQMAERCPNAILIGKGVLRNHRFALDAAGVATVLSDTEKDVEGLIWSLSPSDIRNLDRREGVAIGCYRKEIMPIDDGVSQVSAVIYVSNREIPNEPIPREGYLERIIAAARKHKLSDNYCKSLKILI